MSLKEDSIFETTLEINEESHTRRQETDAVLAVMLLTGTGLWVELYHWRQFTVFAGKAQRTVTPIAVDFINTCASILAEVVRTVVHIIGTVLSGITGRTNTLVMREVVHTLAAVFARIVVFLTELDLRFAVFAAETGQTLATVGLDLVNTCGVVFAFVCNTVIDISLATIAFEA